MNLDAFFVETDVTDEVQQRLPRFASDMERIQDATGQASPPQARLQAGCRACDFFHDACLGGHLEHPIIEIPRLRSRQLDALVARGIQEIKCVPGDFPLLEALRRVVHCVQSGEEYVGASLARDLASVQWPAYYLDFETVMTVLPLYPGVAPHEQIPTQFSIHVCDEPGQVVAHHEYLADPARDCRRELAQSLVQILADRGSVVVYHAPFERGQLAKLATIFPDLAPQLEAVIARLFDLKVAIERGYYNSGFRGSFSIKRVLPVIVPELTYDGLVDCRGRHGRRQVRTLGAGAVRADRGPLKCGRISWHTASSTHWPWSRLHSRLLEMSEEIR